LTTVFAYSFFFQAEDGIRDFHVTGVQTCALPILALDRRITGAGLVDAPADHLDGLLDDPRAALLDGLRRQLDAPGAAVVEPEARSEERRVGKDVKSLWLVGVVVVVEARARVHTGS